MSADVAVEGRRGAIVLIGMPGAGKSTVGVLVAKLLGLGFVDTDLLVQERAGRRLQQIVDEDGYLEVRRLEEQAALGLAAGPAVIATGGSVIYSDRALRHLAGLGVVVYLKAGVEVLAARIDDFAARGIASPAGQGLEDLFRERSPLYERQAQLVVEVGGLTHEQAARAVVSALARREAGA